MGNICKIYNLYRVISNYVEKCWHVQYFEKVVLKTFQQFFISTVEFRYDDIYKQIPA